jgi:hypothetical protein
MHHAHVHDWGIARGLEVNGTIGSTEISINAGVAIDSKGELIVLSSSGNIGTNPPGGQNQEVTVPVRLDLSNFDGQTRYVTIQFSEILRLNEGAGGRFEQVPWLRLQSPSDYVDDGSSILLAIVVIGADGKLAELKLQNSELNHRRRLIGETIEALHLRRSIQAGDQIKEVPAGKIAPIAGGLQISVPNESDRIVLAKEGDGKFDHLDVHANKVSLDGSLSISNKLTVEASGNIGIGTTAPSQKLHVAGNAIIGNSFLGDKVGIGTLSPQSQVHVQGGEIFSGGNAGGLSFGDRGVPGYVGSINAGADGGQRWTWHSIDRKARLWSGSDKLTVEASGNVGIGTTAPSQKLHVANGNAIINNSFLGDVGHSSFWAGFSHSNSANTTGYGVLQSSDGKFTLINKKSGGGYIGFRVDNADKMVIDDKGKVGIGISNPQNLLHVFGTGPVTIQNPNGESDIKFISGNHQQWQVGTNGEGWYVWDNSYRLVVKPGGNVGIGTTEPGFKLDVTDRIRVRQGASGTAGIWFHQSNADRAFLGMETDSRIGFWGSTVGWGLSMNTNDGSVRIKGNLSVNGGKGGYVMDQFVNKIGETLEQGDVVVIGENQSSLYYGRDNNIPILEIDVAQSAHNTRVCGIVCEVNTQPRSETSEAIDSSANPATTGETETSETPDQSETMDLPTFPSEELEKLDRTKIEPGQIGWMVTLGAFAHCKVDADIAPIQVGDLLTTSPTKGHAQKVLDSSQAIGAIVGKALGALEKGQGKIPVLVMLQ